MQMLPFLNRHKWFTSRTDAYIDGELAADELSRFESHLTGCERCTAAIAAARTLKATVAALPEVELPRPFRLTPGMVASSAPAPKQQAGTPVYLGLVRAAAGLSAAAFAAVLVVNALQSSGGASNDSAAQPEASEFGATKLAPVASGVNESVSPEPSPVLAPPTNDGAVAGSAMATPATTAAGSPTEVAGSATPSENAGDVSRASADDDAGDSTTSSVGYEAPAVTKDTGGGLSRLAIALGIAAAGSVLVLAGLELSRRVRRA